MGGMRKKKKRRGLKILTTYNPNTFKIHGTHSKTTTDTHLILHLAYVRLPSRLCHKHATRGDEPEG